jgi:hypothetical protein
MILIRSGPLAPALTEGTEFNGVHKRRNGVNGDGTEKKNGWKGHHSGFWTVRQPSVPSPFTSFLRL